MEMMMNGKQGYVLLKMSTGSQERFTLKSLIASRCNNPTNKNHLIFLTKDILDRLHDDQVLYDLYGNEGTKADFKNQANWKNTTSKAGASAYAAKLLSK